MRRRFRPAANGYLWACVGFLERIDDAQRRNPKLGIAVATFKKFSEDNSTNLATMIAFWAFFSIFPLFLVLVTVLSWVLSTSGKTAVLTHVAQLFPLLDPKTITGLTGSWWAVLLGSLTALWSGLGAVNTVQFAFDSVWEIPYHQRPNMARKVLRSVWVLATIGLGLVFSTIVSGFIISSASGINLGVVARIGGYVLAAALDVGLFVAAFRILTVRPLTTREVLPGAIFAGVLCFILQELSALIISHYLHKAQSTYGRFATVITILWWFYLQSNITLLGAQLNAVLVDGLHPRSVKKEGPLTEADHKVLQAYAAERTYKPEETVEARIEERPRAKTEA